MLLRFDALLIDMDGTLVDSRALVEDVLRAFCARHGLDPAEVIAYSHGMQSVDMTRHYLGDTALARSEAAAIERYETTHVDGIVAMPGAARLLQALPATAWALVTSAGRTLAANRMRAAGLALPPLVVSADDVHPGKPAPDAYLLAARRLGVDPARCIVLEDAVAGVTAGLAAGARVIHVGPEPLQAPGIVYSGSLDMLTLVHDAHGLALRIAPAAASAA